jgi:hypothetical protein
MILLTKEIREKIPKLYSQEKLGDKAKIYAKFFTPWSNWTWYATEGEPAIDENGNEEDFTFFGYVQGLECEFGYFSLKELESIKGPFGLKIERDLYFKNKRIADVR